MASSDAGAARSAGPPEAAVFAKRLSDPKLGAWGSGVVGGALTLQTSTKRRKSWRR